MHDHSSPWRSEGWSAALLTAQLWLGMLLVLLLAVLLGAVPPVAADTTLAVQTYRCDGTPLRATVHAGAVDDPTAPNRSGLTLPGSFVVLEGPDLSLQLPRTNNAGAPSFTDGQWWWSLEDPEHPTFQLRRARGDILNMVCLPAATEPSAG